MTDAQLAALRRGEDVYIGGEIKRLISTPATETAAEKKARVKAGVEVKYVEYLMVLRTKETA